MYTRFLKSPIDSNTDLSSACAQSLYLCCPSYNSVASELWKGKCVCLLFCKEETDSRRMQRHTDCTFCVKDSEWFEKVCCYFLTITNMITSDQDIIETIGQAVLILATKKLPRNLSEWENIRNHIINTSNTSVNNLNSKAAKRLTTYTNNHSEHPRNCIAKH